MSDKLRHVTRLNFANVEETVDKVTFERTDAPSAIFYNDDFMAAGKQTFPASVTAGQDWVKKLQGAGAQDATGVANASFGQVQCALAATSEKEEATLYWGDNRHLDITKGMVFEARIRLSVLPSVAGVQAFWGLAAAWVDGPDNNTRYLEFGATGNGTILMRSQDGTTQNGISTGQAVLATDFHIYRIDMTNPSDVGYFLDGVQLNAPGQIKYVDTTTMLQPMFGVYKPSGTGVATLVADYIRVFSNRS